MSQRRLPIIGITTYSRNEAGEFQLPGAYVDSVQQAGGIPILLPPNQPDPAQILEIVDGLIFSGGGDINPELYGGSHHSTIYLVDSERDDFELVLAKQALAANTPTLGICRGMQMLSVASGAELVTHVPEVYGETISHRLDHPRRPTPHEVQVQPESRLAAILRETEITVISWHHQAVKTVPDTWEIVAHAPDGLVEALVHRHHPWMVSVQWHPELSPEDPVHQRLFQALVRAAGDRG
ncbi:gamma-glutamyl-gamma-aminobutyrate hydrolase family protein [Kovacikia minuta CCNUW1]|uniref:gamma-glutamyl-gamma-aminobutyrate hydrolase family protein n=1 Tax=Kovacikia minuta TaxID=2931930 RepID=UPI001CCEF384|nr:gamma-glutamyl-gamma-aminobutyrate hydrolase family protein [Kovacikia minuta]UBF27425.1 gamma-glutamyl-gamma-aminobutyrate hydrolase family protein [Kovacikia minuta CCNUW1]